MAEVALKVSDSQSLDVSVPGLNNIRSEEGRSLRAYKDVVGKVTIGYGETLGVKMGDVWTPEECELRLVKALRERFAPGVKHALPKCTQATYDAGLSFNYNTGAIAKASWPKALMRGDMLAAEAGLRAYSKGGGRVLPVLVRRRASEWLMISKGVYPPGANSGPSIYDGSHPTGKRGSALTVVPGNTPDTVKTIQVDLPPNANGMLFRGSKGAPVTQIQNWLKDLGVGKETQSGVFDVATEDAVREFQKSHPNLTADGIVGPATRAQLQREWDLWSKAKKQGGTSAGSVVIATGAKAAGFAIPTIVVVGVCVIAVLVVGVLVWKYRDEIVSFANRKLGRTVP